MMRKCQNDPEYKKMIESKMRTTLFAKQHEKVVQELTEASRAKAIADGILQPDDQNPRVQDSPVAAPAARIPGGWQGEMAEALEAQDALQRQEVEIGVQ